MTGGYAQEFLRLFLKAVIRRLPEKG